MPGATFFQGCVRILTDSMSLLPITCPSFILHLHWAGKGWMQLEEVVVI